MSFPFELLRFSPSALLRCRQVGSGPTAPFWSDAKGHLLTRSAAWRWFSGAWKVAAAEPPYRSGGGSSRGQWRGGRSVLTAA
jgi:hypothetical protein